MRVHIEKAKIELQTAAAAVERAARALAYAGAEAPGGAHDPMRGGMPFVGDDPALTDFCSLAADEAKLAQQISARAQSFGAWLDGDQSA